MAKSLFRALAALLLALPVWLHAAPRVISLSPANTELAFAAGITPVGVSSYSDYPSEAQRIEQVSTWQGMNLERIVALKPDLVLAWRGGNAERQVNQLTSLGIRVMWVDAVTIAQIADTLQKLAAFSPHPEMAKRAAQTLLDDYSQLKSQYASKAKNACFCSLASILPLPAEKGQFKTRLLSSAVEKISLPAAGFPGRRSVANRCWRARRKRSLSPEMRGNSQN